MIEDKRDNRLHKLIKFMIEEDPQRGIKYDWKYEELVPVLKGYFKKSDINEVKHLCEILSGDDMLEEKDEGSIHLTHTNLVNARQAYHGKKYIEKNDFWTVPINIATVLAALAIIISLVLGYVSIDQMNMIYKLDMEIEVLTGQTQKFSKQKDSLLHLLKEKHIKDELNDSLKIKE